MHAPCLLSYTLAQELLLGNTFPGLDELIGDACGSIGDTITIITIARLVPSPLVIHHQNRNNCKSIIPEVETTVSTTCFSA